MNEILKAPETRRREPQSREDPPGRVPAWVPVTYTVKLTGSVTHPRPLFAALLLIVVLAMVAACGSSPVVEGVVSHKQYDPAHDESYLLPIFTGNICTGGKIVTCTPQYVYVPQTQHKPDRWRIWLVDRCADYPKCDIDWHAVSHAEYDSVEEGQPHRLWSAESEA